MSLTIRTQENGTDTHCKPATTHEHADLTAFQQNILTVLADEARYGLAIKDELEDYYGKKVNHGRLYPNLDTLVDRGLIEKSELDKRTNNYSLTDEGREAIEVDLEWRRQRIESDEEGGA